MNSPQGKLGDYAEDQLLPISALQHLAFCERQCALIQLEQAWSENRFTAEGRNLHERVHEGGSENRHDLRTATGLRLRSLRLGLSGQADLIEFHRRANEADAGHPAGTIQLPESQGWWQPFPVEYKRGRPKADAIDEVQLCAQAMCLEEMLDVEIPMGALFYGANRRRHEVAFSSELRAQVATLAARLHLLLESGVTPPAHYDPAKCDHCSLLEICQPRVADRSADAYLRKMLEEGP